ncbi:hypothetical protein AKO1_014275 [Acrasis kona]|uniref:Uncharacterized protein n=1 Tax=Acrasis kona TaxID=1008807 RepID=A0AAW2YYY9_9EUKA
MKCIMSLAVVCALLFIMSCVNADMSTLRKRIICLGNLLGGNDGSVCGGNSGSSIFAPPIDPIPTETEPPLAKSLTTKQRIVCYGNINGKDGVTCTLSDGTVIHDAGVQNNVVLNGVPLSKQK